MEKSQLELLVLYQDMNIMLKEAEEEKESLGFSTKGMQELKDALEDLSKKIVGVKRREKVSITSPNVHLLFSEGVDKKTRFLIEENLGKLYKKIDTYPLYQYKPHKGDEPIFLITS